MTHGCLKQAFALGTRLGLLLNLLSWKAAHPRRQPALDCWLGCLRLQPGRFCWRRQRRAGSCSSELEHGCTERLTALPGAKAPYLLWTCWAVSDICPWCTCHESWSPEHQLQQLFLSPRRSFTVLAQQLHNGGFGSPQNDHPWGYKLMVNSPHPLWRCRGQLTSLVHSCGSTSPGHPQRSTTPTTLAPLWELHPSPRQDLANSSALLMKAAWQSKAKHKNLEVGRSNNKPTAISEESEKLVSSDLFKRFSSSPTLRSFGDGRNVTSESLAWIKNYVLHKLNI